MLIKRRIPSKIRKKKGEANEVSKKKKEKKAQNKRKREGCEEKGVQSPQQISHIMT